MRRHLQRWIDTFNDDELLIKIETELKQGLKKYGAFNSCHELYAILKEELEEFWDSVKANDPDPYELLQLCAVSKRGIIEICEKARNEMKESK